MENTGLILSLLLGIFICLFGYRLKKAVFFIAWFLVGFAITTNIMPVINTNLPDIAASDFWQNLLPVAGGLLMSLMGFSIEKACVALLCLFTVVSFAITKYGFGLEIIAVAAVIGILLAGFATMLMKPAVIVVTSIIGASTIITALMEMAPGFIPEAYDLLAIAGIACLSAILQFITTKNVD